MTKIKMFNVEIAIRFKYRHYDKILAPFVPVNEVENDQTELENIYFKRTFF